MTVIKTLVEIKYDDLINEVDVSDQILVAFGQDGLGALTISGIPNYEELREKLLPLSHKLANEVSEEDRLKLEHEPSMYNAGWSFGKEKLGDKPDTCKGSFYANPIFDKPSLSEEEKEKYPVAVPDNIWPTEALPELEPAFKELGSLMYNAVVLLSKQIDNFLVKQIESYEPNTLYNAMKNTRKIKGRLLYYYPLETNDDGNNNDDGWIGWHNDSGFITALTSALFFDHETGEIIPNPDPEGGLYVIDRKGGSVRAKIPSTHLGVQCGECLQILSGGQLVATPHCVRPSRPPVDENGNVRKVGRGTFPMFVDTAVTYPLNPPKGISREEVFSNTTDSKVPPLKERWVENGVTFGQFLGDTFKKYYEWNTQPKA